MGVTNKRTITKTRRKTRDVDQIKADLLSPKHLAEFKSTHLTEDLPDLGRNYCIECAKWFDSNASLEGHRKSKPHKRRVKDLKNPFTHAEANAAAGLGTDNGERRRKVETADSDVVMTATVDAGLPK